MLMQPSAFLSAAAAAPCPNIKGCLLAAAMIHLAFGAIGQAFVDVAERPQVGGTSSRVYSVNFPTTQQEQCSWLTPPPPALKDASAMSKYMAANCPDTDMALGGYP